jgi:multidrug transporter EmrE-like cation transporter
LSSVPFPASDASAARRRPVTLVFLCTLIGAAAQIFMKTGAHAIHYPSLAAAVFGTLTNLPLMLGYCLYGINTFLLALALREGELSMLYPIIALTYVWVTVLSLRIFHETMNPWKALGLALIVLGVGILGRGAKR